MEQIGIRALQQHASAVVRRVQKGEAVEVTDRGHPVAVLVPAARGSILESLRTSGRLRAAEGDLLAIGPPLRGKRGIVRASAHLAKMRAHER